MSGVTQAEVWLAGIYSFELCRWFMVIRVLMCMVRFMWRPVGENFVNVSNVANQANNAHNHGLNMREQQEQQDELIPDSRTQGP